MVNGLLAGAAGGATVSIIISAVDKFSGVFKNVNKQMLIAGGVMTALGVAGLGATKGLINAASSFETAFTGVRKTVELTEKEFGELENRFKDLSKEIPVTVEELSGIGEIAGQLGVEGVDNIAKFTKTIAGIAVTTNLSAEDAATSFARIANVMQEPIENVDKMASVVVDLGNNFATTESEIVNFAQRIAGAGNIAGLTTDQTLAIAAAFSSVGVQAEAGGTAVQKVLIGMNTAVVEGNEKLEIFAQTAGLSGEEFAKVWKDNAGKAFELFVKGLGDQGDKAITTLSDLGLEDQRLIRSFLSLANAGDLITDTLETGTKEWENNTAAVEEAEKFYETTASKVQIMKNKFTVLKVQMAEKLLPTFSRLVDLLGDAFEWFNQHPTITKFAGAALGIGSALLIIVGPLLILVAMLPAMAAGFALLSGSILPITLTILAIAAAFVAVIAAYKAFKSFFKKESDDGINFKDDKGVIHLNASEEEARSAGVIILGGSKTPKGAIALNDFIVTPGGKIIKPSPQDTIIGTKNPGALGGKGVTIFIENVNGLDSEMVSEAMAREVNKVIRL